VKFKPAIASLLVTFAQAFSQFVILITIAKYFTTENVGEYSFVNSIIIPITVMFSCGLRQAYVINSDDYGFRTFVNLRIIGLISSFILGGLLIALLNIELFYVYSMTFIVRSVIMFMELMVAVYQVQGKLFRISISQFIRYVLTTFIFIIASHFTREFDISLLIYAISNVLLLVLLECRVFHYFWKNDEQDIEFISAVKKFFALGVANFTNSIQSNSSRFLLGMLGSSYLLGLFSISYQIYNMSAMVFTSASNFYLKSNTNKSGLSPAKSSNIPFLICFTYSVVLGIGWFLLGDLLIELFLSADYSVISDWIYILLFFLFVRNVGYVFNWKLIGEAKYKLIAKYNTVSLIISIFGNFFLIYYFQFSGANYALGLTSIVYLMFMVYAFKSQKI